MTMLRRGLLLLVALIVIGTALLEAQRYGRRGARQMSDYGDD